MTYFPVVIQFTGTHGLEQSAVKGVDYFEFKFIKSPEDLPSGVSFKIIATQVKI